jgi:hypoxanthine phosphoribosyltransferase|tara:strand:+ start:987 stop:1466 length:480 start_codon:yes stop_codon:yes gene_type:complete
MTSKIKLSWESIEQDVSLLTKKAKDFHPTCILGVANGGMIPATLLAKLLKVDKLLSCNLKSYQDDAPRSGPHNINDVVKQISFPTQDELMRERVLVVDDLVDTGLTLQKIYNNFVLYNDQYNINWDFATLYYKPKTSFMPDYTVRQFDNDAWIVFPWEK